MATEYNITQKQYNGTDYDTLYPRTTSQQVLLNDGEISYTGSATVNGALIKQQADITVLNSKTVLSLTRTEQSWVNETDFARLYAMKRGNMLHLRGNLCVTYGSGFSGGFQQIGTINGWNAASEVYINVPMQNDGSKVVVVQISTSGVIKIYSSTEFSGNPFFRFNVCVPCA